MLQWAAVNNPYVSVAVSPVPFRVPSQWPLVRVSRQPRLSANDKGENEMKPGAVLRFLGIYLMAKENLS